MQSSQYHPRMPSNAYALVALFTLIAVLCGALATWLVGPRRLATVVIPALAAFLALYWVGHRSGLELGPTVELLGFRVAIVNCWNLAAGRHARDLLRKHFG